MRTLTIILGGFALLALCIGAAKLLGRGAAAPIGPALTVFVALWLLVAGANMWIGVARAGYSVREELPIFLLIFLLPASAAAIVWWRVR